MQAGAAVNKLTGSIGGGTDGMCVCAGTKVFKANGEIINIEKLQKKIETLKSKIRKEPQFNKQLIMKKELKELQKTLEEVHG